MIFRRLGIKDCSGGHHSGDGQIFISEFEFDSHIERTRPGIPDEFKLETIEGVFTADLSSIPNNFIIIEFAC